MSNNAIYWASREAKQRVYYGDLTSKEISEKYFEEYKRMHKEVQNLMQNLYQIITVNGTPSANELYKYNRYYEMHAELSEILTNYNKSFWSIVNPAYKQLYINNCKQILNTYNMKHLDKNVIDKTARSLWNAEGKHWSTKVWCNPRKGETLFTARARRLNGLTKLQTTLERGLLDCVARGAPKDQLVREITDRCKVDWHEADRLVRTELTYVQNQSTLASYEASGITEYRYFAHEDDRTSEICRELNNKIFKIKDAKVGVNYPPMHPRCRSTTVPVVNDYAPTSKTLQENAERKKKLRQQYEEGVKKYKSNN